MSGNTKWVSWNGEAGFQDETILLYFHMNGKIAIVPVRILGGVPYQDERFLKDTQEASLLFGHHLLHILKMKMFTCSIVNSCDRCTRSFLVSFKDTNFCCSELTIAIGHA